MLAPKLETEIFRANVRSRCAAIGMTQVQLAEAAGVTQGAISQILRGAVEPRLTTASHIARALGTTVDELLAAPVSDDVISDVVIQRSA